LLSRQTKHSGSSGYSAVNEFAESDAFIILESHRLPTLRPNFATAPSPEGAGEQGFAVSLALVHESVSVRQISTTIQSAELLLESEIQRRGTSVSRRLLRDIHGVLQWRLSSLRPQQSHNCVDATAD
jgi:hypothetical protein